jgi:hypothetical protein
MQTKEMLGKSGDSVEKGKPAERQGRKATGLKLKRAKAAGLPAGSKKTTLGQRPRVLF